MDEMMDAMMGPGFSERMDAATAESEHMMDQCAAMMNRMGMGPDMRGMMGGGMRGMMRGSGDMSGRMGDEPMRDMMRRMRGE
jgi:hypothetical protein